MTFGSTTEKTCVPSEGAAAKEYSFTVKLVCDDSQDADAPLTNGAVDSSDICSPVITYNHAKACPVISVSTFSRFFLDNLFILGLICVSFGLIVNF